MNRKPTNEPQAIRDALAILERDDAKRTAKREEHAKKERARIAKYSRVSFVRVSVHVSDLFKWLPRELSARASLGDVSDTLRPDFGAVYFESRSSELKEYRDDMRAVLRYFAEDMPERIARTLDDDAETDLRRALCSAAENDYEAQFWRWLVDRVDDAASEVGALYVGLDDEGKPTPYPDEWCALSFAVSRREYLDRTSEWWDAPGSRWDNWTNYKTNRERLADAENMLSEFIADKLKGAVNLEHFDERGAVYADPELWPLYFVDYGCDTADAWRESRDAMRAKLREMIRNRAPLEARAALVATVYGVPGSLIETEE